MIFLSDGEDYIRDEPVYDICRSAVRQGFVNFRFLLMKANDSDVRRPLSFHAVSFGHDATSTSLRRMAQIALEIQGNAPRDPLLPATANIPSSYTEALDTVRLNPSCLLGVDIDLFSFLDPPGGDFLRARRVAEKAPRLASFILIVLLLLEYRCHEVTSYVVSAPVILPVL